MSSTDFYKLRKNVTRQLSDNDLCFFNKLATIIRKYSFAKNTFERVGFEVLGPILFGYTIWLREQAVTSRADTIVFLSREGRILERAYKALYEDNTDIRTEYINVSRLSLSKATLVNTESWIEFKDKYSTLFRGVDTIGEILSLFEINVPDRGFNAKDISPSSQIRSNQDYIKLFELIKEYGLDELREQNKLAKEYLTTKGIGNGKTIISDIGWSGTMQLLLQELFPDEKFVGCYIAVSDIYRNDGYKKINKRGFWVESGDYRKWSMIRFTQQAMECLFLCNEGTTIKYKRNEKRVIAVKKKERLGTNKRITVTHDSAINAVKYLNKMIDDKPLLDNSDVWFIPYINFAVYPKTETIVFFRGLSFINTTKEYGFIPDKSLVYSILHLKAMLREFELNGCKTIWLFGLLHIPLPYYEILCFLTEKIRMRSNYEKQYLTKQVNNQ